MEAITHVITSAFSLSKAHEELDIYCAQHPHAEMELRAGKERTQQQNKLIYALYSRATRTEKGKSYTILEMRCLCKLTMGVPILYTEDSKFRESYQRSVKNNFSYEQKLLMMEWFPVTSLMSTTQLSQYIDKICIEYGLEI